MKVIIAALALVSSMAMSNDDLCPEKKQVDCVDDVRAAYEPCKKAAESGGSDLPATLKCLKYYAKTRTDCWPCLCKIAKMEGLHIQGCDNLWAM